MGGFEPVAKPWNPPRIPDRFRIPAVSGGLGPVRDPDAKRDPPHAVPRDSGGEDAAERPGEFHRRRQLHPGRGAGSRRLLRLRGIQLRGHRQCRRRGPAHRRMDQSAARPRSTCGTSTSAALRRFHANRRHLADRTVESLGLHYAMRWPREELQTVRPLRRSPLYDRLRAKGAVFGSKTLLGARQLFPSGWRRCSSVHIRHARAGCRCVLEEQRACREDVVVFDQTSFGKFVLKGRDALAVLQRLCANDIDVVPGRMVYTAMLNARGGFESDLTITRFASDTFFILTGSGQTTRDASLDRTAHRSRRIRRAGGRHERIFRDFADGAEIRTLARDGVARRPVESSAAVLDDRRNRRRLRACARGADELRRWIRASRWSCRPTNA